MPTNWYETFFEGVTLDLWRKAMSPEQTRLEVDFLAKKFALPPAARILDVPCGNGRHSLELAARGYRTTGVDISKGFIAEAQERAAENQLRAEWLLGDMRALPWKAEFDAAFCFGNSFGYLDHAGMVEFIRAVATALKSGARFIIDTGMAAESLLPNFQARRWYRFDDLLFLIDNQYNAAESRLDTEYTFVSNGKVENKASSNLVYTIAELKRLLAEPGFATESLLQSLDDQEFQFASQRLLLVARKQ